MEAAGLSGLMLSSSGPRLKGPAKGGSNLISRDFLLTFSLLSIEKTLCKSLKLSFIVQAKPDKESQVNVH